MTQAAPRLAERDLIALMEKHNIGTDATVAEHIHKQLERGYATKDESSHTFWPTPLGEALVGAYRKMGLENLWLPNLRYPMQTCTLLVSAFDTSIGRVHTHQASVSCCNDVLACLNPVSHSELAAHFPNGFEPTHVMVSLEVFQYGGKNGWSAYMLLL